MHDYIYINPGRDGSKERLFYQFDFAPDLPNDTTLDDIDSGSSVLAYKFDGTQIDSILFEKTRTGMILSIEIGMAEEGEEYRIEFLGRGTQTGRQVIKILEVRSRRFVQGGY